MKQASERKFDRNEVLKKCFDCLVSNGLENTSIRSFSTASGLNSSSLYYWFHNKDEIVLAATLHGLKTIIDDLFTQAYAQMVSTQGEAAADAMLRQCTTTIAENGEIIRNFAA